MDREALSRFQIYVQSEDARKRFLDMITSTDTNSPSPSENQNLQVIEATKALERNGNTSAIMDGSLSTTQQPMSIQPSQGIMTKFWSLCESTGMPIAERLSPAKTELKRIAEKEEHLKLELEDARKDLNCANVKALAVEQTTKDEPMSDGTPNLNSLAKNPCSNDIFNTFSCVVKRAASDLMQAGRARIKDKLAEATEKERRKAREEVESAERKVKQLTERETHLLREKGRVDAAINFYESLSYLASDGGDKLADESLSTGDVTPSR
ncbi:hypothetical protein FMUND_10691 [Fusarium mundagurra]|uniref:Uncharacterized protein n=1 Tax=Fusarium mundagurra TaxID=1567541 RepID=A0A8H5YB74_9HYPO|nr:hypothetical protein FMUND_10691 [Fusarium mundagurra]